MQNPKKQSQASTYKTEASPSHLDSVTEGILPCCGLWGPFWGGGARVTVRGHPVYPAGSRGLGYHTPHLPSRLPASFSLTLISPSLFFLLTYNLGPGWSWTPASVVNSGSPPWPSQQLEQRSLSFVAPDHNFHCVYLGIVVFGCEFHHTRSDPTPRDPCQPPLWPFRNMCPSMGLHLLLYLSDIFLGSRQNMCRGEAISTGT